ECPGARHYPVTREKQKMGKKEWKPTFDWRNGSGIMRAASLTRVGKLPTFEPAKCRYPPAVVGLAPVELTNCRLGPTKHRLKRRSGCKALGHCPDPYFTCASQVRNGKMPMWWWMSDFYPVFYKATEAHRCLAGLHLHFTGVPP
ncbi:hypothetical protein HAX54_014547, partial [Datura stramonium]|nr:hypothetical protein [Datura stramonium]